MATEDFNSGKAAIGTGPFRFVSFRPGDRVELERNDDYWGGKPVWQQVDYRFIPNDAARTAALLAGDVDFIDFVPTEDPEKLRKDPKVKLWERLGLRLIFLGLDQSRDGPSPFVFGPNGEKLGRIRSRIGGCAWRCRWRSIARRSSIASWRTRRCRPASSSPPGGTATIRRSSRRRMTPSRRRSCWRRPGSPRDLRIALHGPNDRYVNDAKIIQAVGQMWTRIGVQTEVDPLPWSSYVGQANKQAFSAFLFGWGSARRRLQTRSLRRMRPSSSEGVGRIQSRPLLESGSRQADRRGDPHRGRCGSGEVAEQAQEMAFGDVAIIPLHIQKNIWATRAGYSFVPTVGETLHLVDVKQQK